MKDAQLSAGVGKQERRREKKALRTPIRGTGSGSPPAHSRRPPPAARRILADGSSTGEAQRRCRHALPLVRRRRRVDHWASAGLYLLDENPQRSLLTARRIDSNRRFAHQVFKEEAYGAPFAAPSRGYDVLGNGVQVCVCRGSAQRGNGRLFPAPWWATDARGKLVARGKLPVRLAIW